MKEGSIQQRPENRLTPNESPRILNIGKQDFHSTAPFFLRAETIMDQRIAKILPLLVTFVLLWLPPHRADAVESSWSIQSGWRILAHGNDLIIDQAQLQLQDRYGWSFLLTFLGNLSFNKSSDLSLRIDPGEWFGGLQVQHQQQQLSLSQDGLQRNKTNMSLDWLLQQGFFLRELFLTFQLNSRWSFEVGAFHNTIAEGAIFDGYSLGINVQFKKVGMHRHYRHGRYKLGYDLQIRLSLPDVSWTTKGKQSPTFTTEFKSYTRDFLFQAFFTAMYDGDSYAARQMLPALQLHLPELQGTRFPLACQNPLTPCPNAPTSAGILLWGGLQTRFRISKSIAISARFIGQYTHVQARANAQSQPLPLEGVSILARGELRLTPGYRMIMRNYILIRSSDNTLDKLPFFGIAPQFRDSQLIFNGGINQHSSRRSVHLHALYQNAPVMGWEIDQVMLRGLDYNVGIHVLLVHQLHPQYITTSENGTLFFPIELNARLRYQVSKWVRIVMQGSILLAGALQVAGQPFLGYRIQFGLDFALRSWDL